MGPRGKRKRPPSLLGKRWPLCVQSSVGRSHRRSSGCCWSIPNDPVGVQHTQFLAPEAQMRGGHAASSAAMNRSNSRLQYALSDSPAVAARRSTSCFHSSPQRMLIRAVLGSGESGANAAHGVPSSFPSCNVPSRSRSRTKKPRLLSGRHSASAIACSAVFVCGETRTRDHVVPPVVDTADTGLPCEVCPASGEAYGTIVPRHGAAQESISSYLPTV